MTGFSLLGVNLSGGEYDPGGTQEGTNYTYPSDAEIDYYASKGMTVIRLPFLLERVEPVPGGPLDTTELGYIDNVVNYAASKGIDVILDPHDYGNEYGTVIGTTAGSNATFANFWGELAAHFASTPNVLFGLMNEPNAVTPTQWLASANAAITAIRASGATTQQILVPGTDWDGAYSWVSSGNAQVLGSGIVDPSHNFAFEVHQYLDADSSGTSSTVVSTEIGVQRLTAITQWAESTGNKLFLGEFGVASDSTSLTALDNMLGYMAQHTDVWKGGTYWAGGPWLGSYMYSIEPANGVDKPQMGVLDQYVTTTIEAAGSTSLLEFGTNFYLQNITSGAAVELRYGGTPVVANQFGAWTFIGAEQTASGYEVALHLQGTDQYMVWDTDGSGNVVSNATGGVVSGTNNALENLEPSFHQDLNGDGMIGDPAAVIDPSNGDGVIGVPTTVVESSGSTGLVQVGNNFYLESVNGATGPELQYRDIAVTAGEFGRWTFVGAEQTTSGYEVALHLQGTDQYFVWDTDSSGNLVPHGRDVSGAALESLEPSFHQDLNGDGVTGLAIAPNATLALAAANSQNVTFENSTGTLSLDNPATFSGKIVGFAGDGTLSGSDHVDLPNLAFSSAIQSDSTYNSSAGALSVSNGTTADLLHFAGNYSPDNFDFASDGHGGTIVYDPPATDHQISPTATDGSTIVTGNSVIQGNETLDKPVAVESGATLTLDHAAGSSPIINNGSVAVTNNSAVNLFAGAGPDNFAFASNFGEATISHFTPGTDTLQFDHQTFASLDALMAATHESAGNAVITDAAHNTLTIENVTAAQLFAHLNDFHLV